MPEDAIQSSASAGASGLTILMFLNLGISFFLKSSINKIWSLFLILQLIKELPQYMDFVPTHLDMVY